MARISECTREFERLKLSEPSCTVDGSSSSESYRTAEQTIFFDPAACTESDLEGSEMERSSSSLDEQIERSMCHWSETVKVEILTSEGDDWETEEWDCDEEEKQEMVNADNLEVFETLQLNPDWGHIFRTFGYELRRRDAGSLVVGEKFAEGGQAELFHAHVTWSDPKFNEKCLQEGVEWVLKVFKKGTLLRHLQKQWPQGMLQARAEKMELVKLGKPLPLRYNCNVMCATFLEDGKFAFLLQREGEDLRTRIDREMKLKNGPYSWPILNMKLRIGQECGPFHKEIAEVIMYRVALGMDWLHSHNIVHRDLKASNVLVTKSKKGWFYCVADFECSIGVIGTGFWRAPEILQALKDKNIFQRPEVFSKEADVYAFGMTCYEILTGKLPFENHPWSDYDIVLNGRRPEVPKYVDDWACELLSVCWQSNPGARPSFGKILNLLLLKSASARDFEEDRRNRIEEIG